MERMGDRDKDRERKRASKQHKNRLRNERGALPLVGIGR